MFESNMNFLGKGILGISMLIGTSLSAQDVSNVDFTPLLRKGDRFVYQLVETKFRQNHSGYYLSLMYDTSYMVFKVSDVNDSQVLVDFNYADAIINGSIYNEPTQNNLPNYLRTETYKLVLNKKGEFIELSNWEFFSSVLAQNLKISYNMRQIDSNTLKYYYLNYQVQENVEKDVIPRVLELIDIFGKSYQLENNYPLAREIVNPFNGQNLLKSCIFRPYRDLAFPNSIFFEGKIKTNDIDNECLQEDYYAYVNQKMPYADSEIQPPYIFIIDTYRYQWGNISKRIISYNTTHTLWLGEEKQGLDRQYTFYGF